MENIVRDGTKGSVEVIQAKYELLKRGSYLMNQDASALKVKEIEPGSRLDLAQARNAVELARLAGADRFAAETYNKAVQQLGLAEAARERRRGGNEIMMPARQAAQTAEDARLVGLQRQEEAYQAEQRTRADARARRRQPETRVSQPSVMRGRPPRRATPQSVILRQQQPLASQPSAIPRQRQRLETPPNAIAPRPTRPASRPRPRARRQSPRSGRPKHRHSRRRTPQPSPNATRSCCEDSSAISSTSCSRRARPRAA
jgi:hypothetical protein